MVTNGEMGPTDVVIIGGGIAGCVTAYELARRDVPVTLVDKGEIGYEQSTRNWGWVHQQIRYPQLIPLAVDSVRLWEGLADELGEDVGWRQGGNLSLGFDDQDAADFERWQREASELGLASEVLSRGEVQELLPRMRGRWQSGLHVPSDGQADPSRVTAVFARAAAGLGARIVEGCAALGVDVAGGRVSGVVTERGTIAASTVVCAAGAWSSRLVRPLGVSFPQRAVRATVVRTRPVEAVTAMTAWGDGVTFRQDQEGRFILAGGASAIYDLDTDVLRDLPRFLPMAWRNRRWVRLRVGRRLLADLAAAIPGTAARREFWQRRRRIDPEPDARAAQTSVERFQAMFPDLVVTAEHSWAGYIDSTPDQAPVLGPAGEAAGLFILTGLSGHGFALGPGAGRLLAQLIVGEAPSVNPHPYRYARFAEGDLAPIRAYRR